MITGFEDVTYDLNDKEIACIEGFRKSLSLRIGKSKAITSNEIIESYEKSTGVKLAPARVRRIINCIRVNNLVPRLIGTQKGYYVAETPDELSEYLKSLGQRIREIQRVERSIAKQLMNWNND